MERYFIEKLKPFGVFTIEDKSGNVFDIQFQFFCDFQVMVDDCIYMNPKMVDVKNPYFIQPYCYEIISDNNYGTTRVDGEKIIRIKTQHGEYLFRRIYG